MKINKDLLHYALIISLTMVCIGLYVITPSIWYLSYPLCGGVIISSVLCGLQLSELDKMEIIIYLILYIDVMFDVGYLVNYFT